MRNRSSFQRVLGDPPSDLVPEALSQWREVDAKMNSFHMRVRARVGDTHAGDVLSKARVKFHVHLRRNGPVGGSPIGYFYTICQNEWRDHFAQIARLAEGFIEDNEAPVEDAVQRIHAATSNGLTLVEVRDEVSRALRVLEGQFSPRELKSWVLAEMYDLDSATIAEYTGTSAGAVRQTVRRARAKLKDPGLQNRLRGWTLASD
ncbi:sigma-70 family RNA polymerase sigma factor [Streptomyces sp. NPDC013171]|uniref:sigma-70 family RNA polymerase sigma factor n=1 Tax=Streptomyces sp. NPDC013171 TaxID=3364863 RepID=UPI003685B0EF